MTDRPNKINIRRTQRGFYRGDFLDIYDNECSIQDSSLAGRDALWLGQNTGTHHLGACVARMHIDTELARELIILLRRFVATGSIKERFIMYRDTSGSGNTNNEQDDDKRKLEEYKEAIDRIEGDLGPVGSQDLNDDSIPTKPPKDD